MSDPASPFTPDEVQILRNAVLNAFRETPPTIGVIGVSGVGKSSTINAMFKTDLPVSHVVACTKEFLSIDLKAEVRDLGAAHGDSAVLRVIDAPGLGEDIRRDPGYLQMYSEKLAGCDVILWVISARNRGMALDQRYLQALKQYHEKIVFGINQIELVAPLNWSRINMPSIEQEENIEIIVKDRKERLQSVLDAPVVLSPYSALKGYNLQEIFTQLIEHCKGERSWLFGALKAFSTDDFIPAEYRRKVQREAERQDSAWSASRK